MRGFARISAKFWTGETGKKIKAYGKSTQILAFYLLTGPSSNMIGIYYLPIPTMAHETGLGVEEIESSLSNLRQVSFAFYDGNTQTIWVPEMAHYQIADTLALKDNQRKGAIKLLQEVACPEFLKEFLARYNDDFKLLRRGFEGASKGLQRGSEGEFDGMLENEKSDKIVFFDPSRSVLKSKKYQKNKQLNFNDLKTQMQGASEGLPSSFEGASEALRSQEQDKEQEKKVSDTTWEVSADPAQTATGGMEKKSLKIEEGKDKAHPLDDFEPDEKLLEWLSKKEEQFKISIGELDRALQLEKFKTHHKARGKGKITKWGQAWQNWMLGYFEREKNFRTKNYPKIEKPSAGFLLFMEKYPNKDNPAFAWVAWKQIGPDERTEFEIMEAVELSRYSEKWREQNGKFIPEARNFLNGQAWKKDFSKERAMRDEEENRKRIAKEREEQERMVKQQIDEAHTRFLEELKNKGMTLEQYNEIEREKLKKKLGWFPEEPMGEA